MAQLCRLNDEGGSYLVLGMFFMVLFLFFAAIGVDVSRFFLERQQAQSVADEAALAGAQALDQVRSLKAIERHLVLDAVLQSIDSKAEYSLDPHSYGSEMSQGDVLFERFPPDQTHSDTYFRVGVNVLQSFEPYFLPRFLFGDDYNTIQQRAIAEAEPRFSERYYRSVSPPEPPIPPLQFGIYSEHHIKPETMDCFTVEGDIHANDGYVTLENMTGDGCGSGNSVEIDGRIEAGDLGTGALDAGDVTLQNIDGYVSKDVVHANSFTASSGPRIDGGVINAAPKNISVPTVPTPEDAPDSYSEPICVFNTGQTFTDLTNDLGECGHGGTVYVKGGLKIAGANMGGDYTFVADDQVTFENTPDLDSEDMFVYSVNSHIKFENVVDATINAQMYAPNGKVKWETSENVTINGSLVSGTRTKLETSHRLTVNFRNYSDLMPDPLVLQGVDPDDIPDYYVVRLIR